MLSIETPSYDCEGTDPRIVAFSRREFEWQFGETIEIPVGLISGWVEDDGSLRCFDTFGRSKILNEAFKGSLTWVLDPLPHRRSWWGETEGRRECQMLRRS